MNTYSHSMVMVDGKELLIIIDISAGDHDCPTGWLKLVQSGVSFCRVASTNRGVCLSATFSIGKNKLPEGV